MNRQNGAKLLLGWASPMRVLLKICVIGLGATALAVVVALTWLFFYSRGRSGSMIRQGRATAP